MPVVASLPKDSACSFRFELLAQADLNGQLQIQQKSVKMQRTYILIYCICIYIYIYISKKVEKYHKKAPLFMHCHLQGSDFGFAPGAFVVLSWLGR